MKSKEQIEKEILEIQAQLDQHIFSLADVVSMTIEDFIGKTNIMKILNAKIDTLKWILFDEEIEFAPPVEKQIDKEFLLTQIQLIKEAQYKGLEDAGDDFEVKVHCYGMIDVCHKIINMLEGKFIKW